MFWVFGGAFLIGASDMYPGEELSVQGKVIVVTINYRVGTLGFVSTTDSTAPGNFGLWDQVCDVLSSTSGCDIKLQVSQVDLVQAFATGQRLSGVSTPK